ncbi:MAG: PaaI family thioesterase [Actinotalea sp.]|nr:PaaI family thioesterase [Actinotalea sp.]
MDDDVLGRAHPGLSLGALDRKMGVVVLEASAERVVATMPVETNTQSFGLLHGGAMASLAEAVGSWAAVLHAGPGRTVVGVDLSATHHRSSRAGTVTAVGRPLHRGSSVATYEVVITDEEDRRLCTARMTSLIRPAQDG